MIAIKNLNLKKSASDLIQTSIYFNEDSSGKSPLLIFAHGFKGFKDWGGFPYLCEKIAENGFVVLSFNFTYNGVSESLPMDFTRLDLFAENTHSIELDDINTVIGSIDELAEKFNEKFNIDTQRVGLIGHSRGGGISVIAASENRNIKALVTLASIAKFDRYTYEQKKRWREKGCIEIPNTRTNQMMRMNIGLLEDIEKNSDRLDILKAASKIGKPYLIIHGKEDLAVRYTDAESIYSASDHELTELHIIENTGHTFGIEHPFKGTTKAFDEVINLTSGFFKKNLV